MSDLSLNCVLVSPIHLLGSEIVQVDVNGEDWNHFSRTKDAADTFHLCNYFDINWQMNNQASWCISRTYSSEIRIELVRLCTKKSWELLKEKDPSIKIYHNACSYRKNIFEMKTNQEQSGHACLHSNAATALTRALWIHGPRFRGPRCKNCPRF